MDGRPPQGITSEGEEPLTVIVRHFDRPNERLVYGRKDEDSDDQND